MQIRYLPLPALLALLLASPALALSTDSQQPINISADKFHGDMGSPNGVGTYTGNVVITQGSIRITADKATVHMKDGAVSAATVLGKPAHFQQQPDGDAALTQGWAERMDYDANRNTVDLHTQARVIQSGRQMAADTIHYNTKAEKVLADSAKQPDSRVHIVIPPKETPPPAANSDQPAPGQQVPPPAGSASTTPSAQPPQAGAADTGLSHPKTGQTEKTPPAATQSDKKDTSGGGG